jgi:hypothetical protein
VVEVEVEVLIHVGRVEELVGWLLLLHYHQALMAFKLVVEVFQVIMAGQVILPMAVPMLIL